uniref:myelin-associated glycoprotein-like isoform X5 n=1 Tax=Scatophagus argus TaxID=75038 RepID=UPI001ED80AE7|nr:myelin-associated glycoprotein-like isoform X5 [Scatophagus argus]
MLSSELSTGRAGGNRSSCNTKKWTHSYNYTLHRVCAMGVTAVVSGNMVTAITLSVVFVSGVLAACPGDSDLFITAPKKMEALNGSCLQIPCSFTFRSEQEFDGSRKTFGVWIKSNPFFGSKPENVIFNSSETVKTYPMRITGNLSEKDCTTLFSSLLTSYTDRYYFRAENRPLVATDICESVQIRVQDSPPRPRIEISGEISGDLKEEQSVTITCSAVTPCPHSPPQLTWSLQQDTRNNTEENADGTFTTKIQETITLSDQHDGNNITCSATYPVNEGKDVRTAQETKTLSVSYAPKDTSVSISPSGLVSAGSWVNLTCSSRAKPPVSFSWFRISKDGPTSSCWLSMASSCWRDHRDHGAHRSACCSCLAFKEETFCSTTDSTTDSEPDRSRRRKHPLRRDRLLQAETRTVLVLSAGQQTAGGHAVCAGQHVQAGQQLNTDCWRHRRYLRSSEEAMSCLVRVKT